MPTRCTKPSQMTPKSKQTNVDNYLDEKVIKEGTDKVK